jgi:hypothetical protein
MSRRKSRRISERREHFETCGSVSALLTVAWNCYSPSAAPTTEEAESI